MSEEEKKMALALREWALQKVFGPALTEIEEDLRKLSRGNTGRRPIQLAAAGAVAELSLVRRRNGDGPCN
jgi:hypothetical protein